MKLVFQFSLLIPIGQKLKIKKDKKREKKKKDKREKKKAGTVTGRRRMLRVLINYR